MEKRSAILPPSVYAAGRSLAKDNFASVWYAHAPLMVAGAVAKVTHAVTLGRSSSTFFQGCCNDRGYSTFGRDYSLRAVLSFSLSTPQLLILFDVARKGMQIRVSCIFAAIYDRSVLQLSLIDSSSNVHCVQNNHEFGLERNVERFIMAALFVNYSTLFGLRCKVLQFSWLDACCSDPLLRQI